MPGQQQTVGISTSVAVFILIISVCCVLSFTAKTGKQHECGGNDTDSIVVPRYLSDIVLSCVMAIGIIIIVIFMLKRRHLSEIDHETVREKLHSKYSVYSTTAFFLGIFTLDLNYIFIALFCNSNWLPCADSDTEHFRSNVSHIVFHICCMVFATSETIVCWAMKGRKFARSQWVWHLLAVVQAANIGLWFDTLLGESFEMIRQAVYQTRGRC